MKIPTVKIQTNQNDTQKYQQVKIPSSDALPIIALMLVSLTFIFLSSGSYIANFLLVLPAVQSQLGFNVIVSYIYRAEKESFQSSKSVDCLSA